MYNLIKSYLYILKTRYLFFLNFLSNNDGSFNRIRYTVTLESIQFAYDGGFV